MQTIAGPARLLLTYTHSLTTSNLDLWPFDLRFCGCLLHGLHDLHLYRPGC